MPVGSPELRCKTGVPLFRRGPERLGHRIWRPEWSCQEHHKIDVLKPIGEYVPKAVG